MENYQPIQPANPHDDAAFIRETTAAADVIHVYGDVDHANADAFEIAIGRPHMVGRPLLVNLTLCTYLDSSGLSIMIRARRRFGSDFRILVNDNKNIERLLRISSLEDILT